MAQNSNLKFCFIVLRLFLLCMSIINCTIDAKLQSSAKGNKLTPRIVGGTSTTTKVIFYVVNIRDGETLVCGASLISSLHVLTAAHCLKYRKRSALKVYTGTYVDQNQFWRYVARMWINSKFSSETMRNDVGLIKLDAPMPEMYAKPIALSSSALRPGQTAQVSGWGTRSEKISKTSNQLRTVNVRGYRKQRCRNQYRQYIKLQNSMFCASVPGVSDACTGDSGGPLVIKKSNTTELCGIVSFGLGCARAAYPGVYTSVAAFRPWISSRMKL